MANLSVGDYVEYIGDACSLGKGGKRRLVYGQQGVIHAIPGSSGEIGCSFMHVNVCLRAADIRLVLANKAAGFGGPPARLSQSARPRQARAGELRRTPSSAESSSCSSNDSRGSNTSCSGSIATPKAGKGMACPEALLADAGRPHPSSFYCPISHQCMHDPVVLTDGHTYERRHIERWLQQHSTSPVSGAELLQKNLVPNHALRNAIEEYFGQILEDHRQAVRQATLSLQKHGNFNSNAVLLKTIDSLMECSVLMNADLSIEQILTKIMNEAKNLVGAEVASVFLIDRQRSELFSTVNSTGGELRIPIQSGIAGSVAASGVPLIATDAYGDPRFDASIDGKTGFKTRNILCTPVRASRGGIIGVAQLINKTDGGVLVSTASPGQEDFHFTSDDRHFFQVLASQAGAVIENSGMFETMPVEEAASPSDPADEWPEDQKPKDEPFGGRLLPKGALDLGVRGQEAAGEAGEAPGPEPSKYAELCPKMLILAKPLLAAAFDSWEMDTLALAELTGNNPLRVLGGYMFKKHGLMQYFALDHSKLDRFLATIEHGYPEANPYHNRAHAASVLHYMHAFLAHGGVAEACSAAVQHIKDRERSRNLIMMAGLLSAIVHDYEHEGVNNDYLVKTLSPKAIRHNDRSPNENHHIAAAFEVLLSPECNFLQDLSADEMRQLRRLVVEMVLGTDMAKNGETLRAFHEVCKAATTSPTGKEHSMSEEHGNDKSGDSGEGPAAGEPAGAGTAGAFVPQSTADAGLALQVALKCADLGHLALHWHAHLQWVSRLECEYFAQGDREKQLGLPDVSFLMDRKKPGVSETQVGFFDFVVLPLFRAFTAAFPAVSPVMSAVEANYLRWHEIEKELKGRGT